MKRLFLPLALLFLCSSILVSCQRDPLEQEDNAQFTPVNDRQLEGEELEAYIAKFMAFNADQQVVLEEVSAEVAANKNSVYCVYSVTNVQGGGCGGIPPMGGTICILCEGGGGYPGGFCPDYTGRPWTHYDQFGNVVCVGTITGGAGAACDNCPPGGFQVVIKPVEVVEVPK